jgi:hypothetical protein
LGTLLLAIVSVAALFEGGIVGGVLIMCGNFFSELGIVMNRRIPAV